MTAGLPVLVDIFRISQSADDVVGGALITGSLVYQDVHARVEDFMPEQETMLMQGLETQKQYLVLLRPMSLIIYERDEIAVVRPPQHRLLNQRLRVRAVQYDSVHPRDSRGHIELTVEQVRESQV